MSARFSSGAARAWSFLPPRARNERGGILVLTAVMLVGLLATAGLAVDFGQVYITRSQLSSVADAGALAGARIARLGQSRATSAVMGIAAANGLVSGTNGAAVTVQFTTDAKGRQTVGVSVSRTQKLFFAALVGIGEIPVRAAATATGPPVDLVMVLDQSGSLVAANAWDDVQVASRAFVDFFGDNYDKMALVSFQSLGAMRVPLSSTFKTTVRTKISQMSSFGSTNMAEGLRMARDELRSTRVQPNSLKAVIFFTDGYANTYRTSYNGRELIIGTRTNGSELMEPTAGYLTNPDQQPVDGNVLWEDRCDDDPRSSRAVCPSTPYTPRYVVDQSEASALAYAAELRAAGVYVYTIGMKDTNIARDPNMPFLRIMANENGIANASQPQGKAYYAPSGAELQAIFSRVATDIMVHLVR